MIGKEVRRRREDLGLTGAQLAARAGMAPSAVSQIETGRRTPSSASVIKLAAALNIEVGDLYPKGQAPLPLEVAEQAGHTGSEVSEEERRFLVRGWEVILEDLAARCQEAEKELRAADINSFPDSVVDVAVLAGYNFQLLSREAEEVKSAPGVIGATEKIRKSRERVERMLKQKFGPMSNAHAAQHAIFTKAARDAEASLASMEEDRDEGREIS